MCTKVYVFFEKRTENQLFLQKKANKFSYLTKNHYLCSPLESYRSQITTNKEYENDKSRHH